MRALASTMAVRWPVEAPGENGAATVSFLHSAGHVRQGQAVMRLSLPQPASAQRREWSKCWAAIPG
jgi:hypothetical protein